MATSIDRYNDILRNRDRELARARSIGEHGTLEEIQHLMICPSAQPIIEEFPPLGAKPKMTVDSEEEHLLRSIHYERLDALMDGALRAQNFEAILLLNEKGCILSPSIITRTYCSDLIPELASWMLENYLPDLYMVDRVFIRGTVRMKFLFLEHNYAPDQAQLQIDDDEVLSWLKDTERSLQPRTVDCLFQDFLPTSAKYLLDCGYRPTAEAYVKIPSSQILQLLADYGLVPTFRNLDYAVLSNNYPLAKYLLKLELRPSTECLSSLLYDRHVQVARLLQYYNMGPILPRERNYHLGESYAYCSAIEAENWLKQGIIPADLEHEMDLALIHGIEMLVQIFHRFGIKPTAEGLEQAQTNGHSALLTILNEAPRTHGYFSDDEYDNDYGLRWV